MIYPTTMVLGLGVLLDLLLGDPRWLPHPIRGIGLLISALERALLKCSYQKLSGCILVIVVLLMVVATVALTLRWGGFVAAAYWIFTCLAVRSLYEESHKVITALSCGDLNRARSLVGYLVGRDTKRLSQEEIS